VSYNVYLEKLEILNDIKKTLIKKGQYFGDEDLVNEKIIEAKREYRKFLKEKHNLYYGPYMEPIGVIVNAHWEYDGGWMKVFFEGEHWTEEEKHEFIEENWHHYRPTFYDCTGQIFTNGIDVFNVPSGVVAYIREAIDC